MPDYFWRKMIIFLLGAFCTLVLSFGVIWIPHSTIHQYRISLDGTSMSVNMAVSFFVGVICTIIAKYCVFPLLNEYKFQDDHQALNESLCEELEVENQAGQDLSNSCDALEHQLKDLSALNQKARVTLRRRASPSARALSVITMSTLERVRSSGTTTPSALDVSPIQPIQSGSFLETNREIKDTQSFSESRKSSSQQTENWKFFTQDTSEITADNSDVFEKATRNIQLSDIDLSQSMVDSKIFHDISEIMPSNDGTPLEETKAITSHERSTQDPEIICEQMLVVNSEEFSNHKTPNIEFEITQPHDDILEADTADASIGVCDEMEFSAVSEAADIVECSNTNA